MRKTGTGNQTWPLTSPLSSQDVEPGGEVRFDMNDVPDRAPSGPLAYYVPALIITVLGALINAGEGPDPVSVMNLPALIFDSVEVRDCWHGTPVSSVYWLGQHLRIHEFIGAGYEYVQRMPGDVTPAASPGTPVSFQVRIPLSAGEGQLIRETSMLALCYQPGSVMLNFNEASVLDDVSDGTTFTGTVRVSLELDPRPEIVLGTCVEHVLHRQVSAPNDPDIQIKGFGRSSKLSGVLPKGGVLALMELTNATPVGGVSLGGVFAGGDVNSYSFDWRGQKITKDVRSVLSTLVSQIGDSLPDIAVAASNESAERTVFPYTSQGATDGRADPLNDNLMAWLMVLAGKEARLTDAQTADNDQTYHLDLGQNTYDTGDHLQIARYARVWAQGKRDDFEVMVKKGGASSLAAYVLGAGYAGATLKQRAPVDKHTLTADQTAYLAFQLI